MLQSATGVVVDATPIARNTPVHQLNLGFEQGQLRIRRQDPPWKVVRAFPQPNGSVLAHLHNVSGGVLAGDRLELKIELAEGVAAQVTTTGATRLYRHRSGAADSEQNTSIALGPSALLEYLPDPIIPYAGARHTQRTEVRLAPRAALFWWEVLAPGRQAKGERFEFERLQFSNRIYSRSRLVLNERFVLDPVLRPLAAAGRMERYSWMASLFVCQEGRTPACWRALEDELNEFSKEKTEGNEVIWGVSMLAADGLVVRGLATNSRIIHGTLIEFWRFARRRITGQEVILPRKVY